jgi:phospholipid/cholesterol/gamma-HCH transport system substrate-binding protein
MSADLAAITDKLNRGDGTLGGLINDPQLIEDLRNVVRGVRQSRILSWFIRNSREEGEKHQLKQEEKLRRELEQEPRKPKRPDTGEPGGSQGEM